MRQFLLLKRLQIENANAVAGLTWGFPAISHFLGFTHALDRKLRKTDLSCPEVFGGCAIICHRHQHLTKRDNYKAHHFCLTRNPLTKEGKTAPFNEEGRMHLEISLLVEMKLSTERFYEALNREDILDEQQQDSEFIRAIEGALVTSRLAGGRCINYQQVTIVSATGTEDKIDQTLKRMLFGLLPGFAIIDRSELLQQHSDHLMPRNDISAIEAWMDFGALRYQWVEGDAHDGKLEKDDQTGEWQRVSLPETGWFVPLMLGYQPIAELQAAGAINGSRDPDCPLCPVEAVYGVGQWLAPMRVAHVDELLWRYSHDENGYHFQNISKVNTAELES
jgi:CRISPR-associated protein Csy2